MAASPKYKIYRGKEYVASCKYPEDAAKLIASDEDTTVRLRHSIILWREGSEKFSAAESYDEAAEVMRIRKAIFI